MTETTCDTTPAESGNPPTVTGGRVHKGARTGFGDRDALKKRRRGLVLGELPSRYKWASSLVASFRTFVEGEVIAARGEITLMDSAYLSSACRWERHGLLCQKLLKDNQASLTPPEIAKLSEQAAAASAKRDASLEKLKLPSGQDAWNPADLYRLPASTIVHNASGEPIEADDESTETTPDLAGTPQRAGEKLTEGI